MAFVLKKKADFEFQIEGSDTIYTIPAIDTLNLDEVEALRSIRGSQNLKKNMDTFKKVLFSKCEGLEEANLSDFQMLLILQAYEESQGEKVGES